MDDRFHEHCAVFGIFSDSLPAAELTYYGLYALQHRGQESSGIAVCAEDGKIICQKRPGLVAQVFSDSILEKLPGTVAIGHNRYATSGGSKPRFVQPLLNTEHTLAVAHNGNLPDTTQLEKFLNKFGVPHTQLNDTQLMVACLTILLAAGKDMPTALREAFPLFTGVFCLTILYQNTLYAVRDQFGVRPLVIGQIAEDDGAVATVIASETCALDAVGATYLRDVEPGELICVSADGMTSQQLAPAQLKLDIFELVYFARPDSQFFGESVYQMRRRMGQQLAREFGSQADLVVPVPDSAIPAAEGFAEESGIPLRQILIKNRYIHRTFIQPTQAMRDRTLKQKLNLIGSEVKGKRVVVIDDSIVRGSTSKRIVRLFTEAGATAVHFLSCSPPVKYPDFYGIDTPSQKDLLAATHTPAQIAKKIGATAVQFLSFSGLLSAVSVPETSFTTACFTGEYPVAIGKRQKEIKQL